MYISIEGVVSSSILFFPHFLVKERTRVFRPGTGRIKCLEMVLLG